MPETFNSRPICFVTADLYEPTIAPMDFGFTPCGGRGEACCIFMNDNDPMNMIGHDNIGTQFGMWEMFGDKAPVFFCNLTHNGQSQFTVDNFTK